MCIYHNVFFKNNVLKFIRSSRKNQKTIFKMQREQWKMAAFRENFDLCGMIKHAWIRHDNVSLLVKRKAFFSLMDEHFDVARKSRKVKQEKKDDGNGKEGDVASHEGRIRREVKIGHAVAWYRTKAVEGIPLATITTNVGCCAIRWKKEKRANDTTWTVVTNGTRRKEPKDPRNSRGRELISSFRVPVRGIYVCERTRLGIELYKQNFFALLS